MQTQSQLASNSKVNINFRILLLLMQKPRVTRWVYKPVVVAMIILLGTFHAPAGNGRIETLLVLTGLLGIVWVVRTLFLNKMFEV